MGAKSNFLRIAEDLGEEMKKYAVEKLGLSRREAKKLGTIIRQVYSEPEKRRRARLEKKAFVRSVLENALSMKDRALRVRTREFYDVAINDLCKSVEVLAKITLGRYEKRAAQRRKSNAAH